ncbi:hypothetical protein ACOSQ4_005922 [Xanthoceras sorbifolium]
MASAAKFDSLNLFSFSFFVERAVITVLMLFSLSQVSFLPGHPFLIFDPLLVYIVDVPIATTFLQMVSVKFGTRSGIVFCWERLAFFLMIPYEQFRCTSCLFIAVSIFVVTTAITMTINDHDIDQMMIDLYPRRVKTLKKEAKDKSDGELLGTGEINVNEKESNKEAEEKLGDDEKKKEAAVFEQQEEELEMLKNMNEVCIKNLEEEKKTLMLKLEIANEAIEYYQDVVKDFTQRQSLIWVEDEKVVISSKLEEAASTTSASQSKKNIEEEEEEKHPRQDDHQYYNNMAAALAYDYESYYNNCNWHKEKQELTAKLDNARRSSEFYKACLNDYEEIFRNLRIEITELSAKLFAETLSAERFHKLSNELEEKYRKLEEEKDDLSAKLNAAKALSELYRSILHDSFTSY